MPRRSLVTALGISVVAAAVLVAVVMLPALSPATPQIETKAPGVWQETDSAQAYRLEIRRDAGGGPGVSYTVTYPRSFKVPFSAFLTNDEIRIWGENTDAIVWIVTYDDAGDTLTVTRPWGSESHTLRRVSG